MTVLSENINADLILKERTTFGNFLNNYHKLSQYLVWPLVYVISSLFLKVVIRKNDDLDKLKSPFIVISNHVSMYDSFLLRLVFTSNHLPLRFMAVKKFDWKFLNFLADIRVIDAVYSIFGVFTVIKGRGIRRNLMEPVQIINSGGNIVIYPEGRINKSETLTDFKLGAALLSQQTGAPILPISFKIEKKTFCRDIFRINIGKPFVIGANEDLVVSTRELQRKVEILRNLQ